MKPVKDMTDQELLDEFQWISTNYDYSTGYMEEELKILRKEILKRMNNENEPNRPRVE